LVSLKKFNYTLKDAHMPDKIGFEAAKWIREKENPNQENP
jgi:hypothetical protein